MLTSFLRMGLAVVNAEPLSLNTADRFTQAKRPLQNLH